LTNNNGDAIWKFTSTTPCVFDAPEVYTRLDILIVGGGGGAANSHSGAGGGGQVETRTGVTLTGQILVTTGAGGAARSQTEGGVQGGTSSLKSLDDSFSLSALGGSGGRGRSGSNVDPDGTPNSGGFTGGGGAYADNATVGTGTTGTGGTPRKGGDGSTFGSGGGGGAGGAGLSRAAGATGGIGVQSNFNETSVMTYYGGGGGGARWNGAASALGGLGGGGNGNTTDTNAGSSGVNGLGGGGGAGSSAGGNGGSGVVYIIARGYQATVAFDINGGTGTTPTSLIQSSEGQSVTLDSGSGLTRSGYTFSGWNTKIDGTGTTYAASSTLIPSGDLTLYALWSYTITYDGNGNTSETNTVPNAVVRSTWKTYLETGTGLLRTGYTFAGWNTAADGSGTNFAAGLNPYTATGDITLYAQWNSTITYNGNNLTSAAGTVPASVTTTGSASNTFNLPTAPTLLRTNYTLNGWNTRADGTGTTYRLNETFTATGNQTLYAIWRGTLTFNANVSTSGSVPTTMNIDLGSVVTLPANPNNLAKTGNTLVGWNTSASGGFATRYQLSDTLTTQVSTTLYAEWIATCAPVTNYANGDQILTVTRTTPCAYTEKDRRELSEDYNLNTHSTRPDSEMQRMHDLIQTKVGNATAS
jgi:uncharacterized repeat protein (TIGR02543 family)